MGFQLRMGLTQLIYYEVPRALEKYLQEVLMTSGNLKILGKTPGF